MGNDGKKCNFSDVSRISIHVPAWGTTICLSTMVMSYGNFNPRSRVGNDIFHILSYSASDYFNPRSRVGNDSSHQISLPHQQDFNPRSRVGNDIINPLFRLIIFNFNPRSRVGNDCSSASLISMDSRFQSTFPRGERLNKEIGGFNCDDFNPRSRVGNDYKTF